MLLIRLILLILILLCVFLSRLDYLALRYNAVGIILRRHASVVFEAAVEVGYVVEAHHVAHLGDAELAFAQQVAGAVYAQLVEV